MRRFILVSLLAFAALLPTRADAAGTAVNGDRLLAWCQSKNPDEQSTCLGYVMSVADILSDQTIYQGRACLPPTTTADELRRLVVLFLSSNPQHLEKASGANLAALAMMHAYPCKEGT